MPDAMDVLHDRTLEWLIDRLREVDGAVAIATYGTTATRMWTPYSDLDVMLWVDGPVAANSVHFFTAGIPVDLNVKSLSAWQSGETGWLPPSHLHPVWDPQGVLTNLSLPKPAAPHAAEHFRYAHNHRLLKLQQVVGNDDEIADFLVAASTHWIAVSWCHARGQRFPGIDKVVQIWRQQDPEMVSWLLDAIQHRDRRLEFVRLASERALEPIGGLVSATEILLTAPGGGTVSTTDREQTLSQLSPVFKSGSPGG